MAVAFLSVAAVVVVVVVVVADNFCRVGSFFRGGLKEGREEGGREGRFARKVRIRDSRVKTLARRERAQGANDRIRSYRRMEVEFSNGGSGTN